MPPKLTICLLVLCLFGCSEKDKTQKGGASIEAGTKPDGAKPEAGQKPDGNSSWVLTRTKTDAAMPNYDEVAEEACNLAGGICDNSGENCGPAPLENFSCGPGRLGVMCCRPAPEPNCAPPEAACCEEEGGLNRTIIVVCDRGYPSCGIPGFFLSSDGSCSEKSRVPFAAEDAPSKWENAISAAQAVRVTCEKYGGKIVSKNDSCDRLMPHLASRTQICCATEASCPDEYVNSECCNASGEVEKKSCFDGRFSCDYSAIGSGTEREVEAGTCKPFDIDS